MQKRNIDDDEIILVEDKRDRFFLTQDHNGRKSIIKGGWIGDSQTQYMLIKQYFLQRNGNYMTTKSHFIVLKFNFQVIGRKSNRKYLLQINDFK